MSISGYAALAARESLHSFSFTPGPLGPTEVEISVTHCGICHSDIHLIDNDWMMSSYPFIPGHEVIGHVVDAGPMVSHLKTGDRVGVGWMASACLECESCAAGLDNSCVRQTMTCVGRHGGYATRLRADGHYAFPIPDALSSEVAAPLLCAGITVFSPLHRFARPGSRVGVVGIGGLGHLALRYAHAFGTEVTALSTSAAKDDEAKRLGAHRFLLSSNPSQMEQAAGSLDVLVVTASGDLDWGAMMNLLRPRGTMCFVGAVPAPVQLPVFSLIMGERAVAGSAIGGRAAMREMLEFSARHGIGAQVEVTPMSAVNDAIAKVRAGGVRYRMVLAA